MNSGALIVFFFGGKGVPLKSTNPKRMPFFPMATVEDARVRHFCVQMLSGSKASGVTYADPVAVNLDIVAGFAGLLHALEAMTKPFPSPGNVPIV